jgi:hypothetical protein
MLSIIYVNGRTAKASPIFIPTSLPHGTRHLLPSKDVATVRAVGSGAGNFTYILVQGAGHFVDPVYFTCSSFLPLLIQLGIG